ncbi:MAG TPA: molybdenum hydroxylase, partial [bacterium]|nr:molybdenum hydroxylase [bacterium]
MQSKQILIKGAGEMASAVAHRLFRCGYSVVMADIAQPTAVRRRVSFCSAIYEGEIEIEGVKGIFNQAIGNEQWATRNGKRETGDNHISILIDPQCHIKNILKPDVIIDARLLKHNLDNHLTDAPLTIALGPGIEAGKDVHVVIETNRGHALGRIITKGFAEADTGNPGVIGGYSLERVFR